ncbi:hypothetical protein A1359_21155 [Methylomonas lenta]|uniref:Uncharacterized protein n=1 Tax=Methylomonas lenta TaxID=980561 RepID=A0A177NQM4_9GAMM|nr:hypothetical protein A1359_21155 [Methylomonas lenta]
MALAELPGLILIIRPIGAYVKRFQNHFKIRQDNFSAYKCLCAIGIKGSGKRGIKIKRGIAAPYLCLTGHTPGLE